MKNNLGKAFFTCIFNVGATCGSQYKSHKLILFGFLRSHDWQNRLLLLYETSITAIYVSFEERLVELL